MTLKKIRCLSDSFVLYKGRSVAVKEFMMLPFYALGFVAMSLGLALSLVQVFG